MTQSMPGIALTMLVGIALASCRMTLPQDMTGSLVVHVDSARPLTLEPDISMVPAQYQIMGLGPRNSSFDASSVDPVVELASLAIGDWHIVVYAENADGTLIGIGEADTTVHTDRVESLAISVRPATGTGTIDIEVAWQPELVELPLMTGWLFPASGPPVELVFLQEEGQAMAALGLIESGYYTMTLQLEDSGILVAGAVETVRILSGQITSGRFLFDNLNAPGGTIDVAITPDMQEPLEVIMTGAQATIAVGEAMTVTAQTDADGENATFAWYLNGSSVAVGDTFEVGPGLEPGFYRLDVAAFTTDGTRGGSASHTFEKTE